ncbi:hypothetical protein B6U99_01940 [Candidatus Geothermarchaeota archaeon ex4572_27]|nr:MAG: hypothetical protein B6U99_01940 [Candidatus Geothermarchaeota archaeon ex4572_27]
MLPTLRRHHTIKSTDDEMTDMVDYTEYLLARGVGSRDALSDSLMGYIASALKEQKSVAIEHISVLTGEVKQLTPGQPVSVEEEGGEIACVLRRSFRGGGILDGLGVPKEAGDYDLMEVSTRLPILLHKYYSRDGRFKGLYVNVNTPPEISKIDSWPREGGARGVREVLRPLQDNSERFGGGR